MQERNVKRSVLLSLSETGEQSRSNQCKQPRNRIDQARPEQQQQQQHFGEYYSNCC